MKKIREYYDKVIVPGMIEKFGYKNKLAAPKIIKIVISTGTGSLKDNSKKETIEKSLAVITGQKAYSNPAKKSIASFKLRQGSIIGYSVVLRGKRMYDFLQKFINVTLPRVRDFRGINPQSIDAAGNLSIGLKEHVSFPETSEEDIRNTFGLNVTIITNAKKKEEAFELLHLLGLPFKVKK